MSATVHLIDDDTSFLRATARMLRASGYQVAIHGSATGFLAWLSADASGCIVADLDMPDMDGTALQDALEDHPDALPIIFLTGHGDIPASVRAIRHGAEDFLTKTAPREDLMSAIDRAMARNARQRRESRDLAMASRRFSTLSAREREVLSHVVRGRLNKQIAADLGICERTVKLHRTAITTKIGVQSAAELAVLATEVRLFAPVS